ncbi:hypothetical protein PV755_08660 [Streptomyces caniscabiei]|uniref:Uncharacterized protein n=1 Tax=Streptomyces caniscabiei TaxID=2746961 RepID=A0A927QIE5_9ACTN|nr:hypothetical protein [Streptomyces caniscabiei]MBD9721799.1 hypothetical protein [Streptomyces caniscabiei]MDX3508990.1 hypothetical protein [Streptomyces caniscabiei]MDX3717257.1 hypothetical protein [Streptomyces caniscabiei]WEO23114.1 hypothetical protein IHE65_08065 [Streptomyces caniscabiei]
MRALVSRALLLSPLVCGALVFGPVGTATAAVDAGRTASDRAATRAAAVPEPDLDAFFDALEKEIDALVEKEEVEADAIVDKEIADMEALFDKLDSDLDALLAGLDADTDAAAEAATGTATETDAVGTEVDDLLGQLDLLDRMDQNDVLAPLLDEMTAVAELDAGQLDTAEAARHVAALRTAHATVQQRLQKIDAAAPAGSHRAAAADPVADLLAALQAAVDALLKALTSLDLGAVLGAVTGLLGPVLGVVTGLLQPVLGLVTGLLGGLLGGLPASTLPAIPAA